MLQHRANNGDVDAEDILTGHTSTLQQGQQIQSLGALAV